MSPGKLLALCLPKPWGVTHGSGSNYVRMAGPLKRISLRDRAATGLGLKYCHPLLLRPTTYYLLPESYLPTLSWTGPLKKALLKIWGRTQGTRNLEGKIMVSFFSQMSN